MAEVMKIMAPHSKGLMHALPHSVPLPCRGHRWPMRPPETPWHSRASLAESRGGHCSFLLGPGAHKVLYVPSKGLFPQARVSSGSSLVRLMVTSSKRACAIPRSDAPRASAPMAGPCWPVPPQETLRGWSGSFSVGSPVAHKLLFQPSWVSLVGMGFHSNCNFTPPTILLGLLLCPWMWDICFCWDPIFLSEWLFSSEL